MKKKKEENLKEVRNDTKNYTIKNCVALFLIS